MISWNIQILRKSPSPTIMKMPGWRWSNGSMPPGITNLMTRHAADQLETVDTIRISHGAFRPVAFSPAIAETTRVEYDPELPSRVVYENGKFIQVPPFPVLWKSNCRRLSRNPHPIHYSPCRNHDASKVTGGQTSDDCVGLMTLKGGKPSRKPHVLQGSVLFLQAQCCQHLGHIQSNRSFKVHPLTGGRMVKAQIPGVQHLS